MDTSYLLRNFRPAVGGDIVRKHLAFRYARNVLKHLPDTDQLLERVSTLTKNFIFGGDSDDSYFTSLMAVLQFHVPGLDSLLGAALNKTALQLEFQTRFLGAETGPELFFYDGPPILFCAAMANTNACAGLMIDRARLESALPAWVEGLANLEYNRDNVHMRPPEAMPAFLRELGRQVGAVGLVLPLEPEEVNLADRYAALADYVGPHTSYLIGGAGHTTFDILAQMTSEYPDAAVTHVTYRVDDDGAEPERGLILIDGVDGLPSLSFRNERTIACRFVMARDSTNPDFRMHDYKPTEHVIPKPPAVIQTCLPITNENLHKMTDTINFFHNLVEIRSGTIFPLRGAVDSSYIHFAGNGEVALDAGNEHSRTEMIDLYANGADIAGVRLALVEIDQILEIDGPAMPLTFTPDVHLFFSHFLLQCLPRLMILRDIGAPDAKIIVPHNIRAKQRAMLHLAGVDEDRIVTMPEGAAIKAGSLLVPRAWPLAMTPYTARLYQEMLRRVVPKRAPEPTRKLLISRESRRSWRNMVNYDAVRFHLEEEHGFQVVRPETLTIEEEITLFNEARIIVGAEGAGLYGSCFSQKKANVISLCDEDYMMPILGTIAAVRGFTTYHVFGESFRADRDLARRLPYGHCDFSIDPLMVEEMLGRCT